MKAKKHDQNFTQLSRSTLFKESSDSILDRIEQPVMKVQLHLGGLGQPCIPEDPLWRSNRSSSSCC